MADVKPYEEREVPRTTGRDILDLIRQHAGERQDGWVYPCEAVFDGTRVQCIGYGRPPDGDDWEERPTRILAIVVDEDLALHVTPIGEETDDDEGIVDAELA